ncbi:MAG: hypothetical protein U1F77_08925 [Kiritimatiellia bacterium]
MTGLVSGRRGAERAGWRRDGEWRRWQAAAARGLDRDPGRQALPVVVQAAGEEGEAAVGQEQRGAVHQLGGALGHPLP